MDVWKVVCDPYCLPRWWPRVKRVEDLRERRRGSGSQWTSVLQAKSGRDIRADYRSIYAREGEAIGWAQDVKDSPFEKLLKASQTSVELADAGQGGTEVTLILEQKFRGLNRLGGPIARRAAARQLEEALDDLGETCAVREERR